MDGFEHFGSNEGAASDDSFQGNHLAKMCCLQSTRAHMVIAKRSAKADFIIFRLYRVFIWIIDALDHIEEGGIEGGEVIERIFEKPICIFAFEVAQIVDIHDKTRLVRA